jgi:hypothetical protein
MVLIELTIGGQAIGKRNITVRIGCGRRLAAGDRRMVDVCAAPVPPAVARRATGRLAGRRVMARRGAFGGTPAGAVSGGAVLLWPRWCPSLWLIELLSECGINRMRVGM